MFMAAAKALALSLRQQSGGRPVAAGCAHAPSCRGGGHCGC
jgi:hypothetical protein